jgi:hypothetical protein
MMSNNTLSSIIKTYKRLLQKILNIVISAFSTTTANNFKRPLTESSQLAGLSSSTDTASQCINKNDVRVKPTKAARPPVIPPLSKPMANPTWLEPGQAKFDLKILIWRRHR